MIVSMVRLFYRLELDPPPGCVSYTKAAPMPRLSMDFKVTMKGFLR